MAIVRRSREDLAVRQAGRMDGWGNQTKWHSQASCDKLPGEGGIISLVVLATFGILFPGEGAEVSCLPWT